MTKTICGLPAKLALYIAAVGAVAFPLIGAGIAKIALQPPSVHIGLAVAMFFVLALLSDLRPVPLGGEDESDVSIANVFMVTAAVLFGWQYAVVAAALSAAISLFVARTDLGRIVFNTSMYGLAAAMAALPAVLVGHVAHDNSFRLTGLVLAGGALHLATNYLLVAGAISLAQSTSYWRILLVGLRFAGPAFAVMTLLAALATNLWVMDSWLLVLLAGPLFTLTLYQRTALHSRIAARDARTDNLTGLGNHRAYQAALRRQIEESQRTGEPFSLCLVDLDNFKHINDTYGHPVGDDVLVRVSQLLATVDRGQAFRFGGDEFAVLVALDELSAYREMERVQQGFARYEDMSPEGALTISAGIATFPTHAADADALQRTADGALYWSKAHGKNRSCLYSPNVVRILGPHEIEQEAERFARLRAAKNLVRFVDARDPSTATHSQVVSSLAEAIGIELGLDPDTVDALRLGGLLHDIGKIGLPDAILRARRSLTADEFEIVKKHPEFGYSLLDGMGIDPVDEWVLHHHEHWDGSGYPSGLAGEEIPLGSRIILAADAFEAITADRPYRRAQWPEAALAELRAHAGTQFDPTVVAALVRHVERLAAESGVASIEALA